MPIGDDTREKFASDLALMKYRAGQLGLWRTMQRLEPAVTMVGFEMAGTPEACEKLEKQRKASEQ